ncbi:MAG TPA: LysE family transporter [Sumerlaeia bacterium]|nr:LysE family transporter [Sumerlaeia bacterium]
MAVLSFVTGFSGAMMPGPLLVAVIEQTAIQGFPAMLWLVTGHAVLELALVVFLIAGLQAVVAREKVRGGIGIVGGAALLWMGCDMLRHAFGVSLDLGASANAAYGVVRLLLLGAAVCAANPYFTGWWATVGAGQLAHMAPRTPGEYLAFYLGHEGADYVWYGVVAAIIITGKNWLTDGVYHGLILVCGGIIACLGAWFLVKGITLFLPAKEKRGDPYTDR